MFFLKNKSSVPKAEILDIQIDNIIIRELKLLELDKQSLVLYIIGENADTKNAILKKVYFPYYHSYKKCTSEIFIINLFKLKCGVFYCLYDSDWLKEFNRIYLHQNVNLSKKMFHYCIIGADVSYEILADSRLVISDFSIQEIDEYKVRINL